MTTTTNYKITSIVEEFLKEKTFKKKDDVLVLLMKLKESLEFNATIDWKIIFEDLGKLYNNNNPFYSNTIYTPEIIEELKDNEIFVYGSNYQGIIGGGAAKVAFEKFGAINGQIRGLVGQSYAIPTKDLNIGERSADFIQLNKDIEEFLEFATINQDKTFYMTKIGCGLSGYNINEIAILFANKVIPSNVIMPIEFINQQFLQDYLYSESKNKFFKLKDNILNIITPDEPSINTITDDNIRLFLPKDCQICQKDDYNTALSYVLDKITKI